MTHNVSDIVFDQMPDSRSMAVYKDRLIIYDNINVPLAETFTDDIKAFLSNLPVKIDFTIVVICLQGGLEVNCNLQHYSVAPGEVIIFVPGTIGEKLSITPDSKVVVLVMSDDSFSPSGRLKRALYSKANFTRPIKFGIEPEMIWPAIQEYQHLKHAILHFGKRLTDELVNSYIMVLTCFASMSMESWSVSHPQVEGSSNKIYRDFLDLIAKNYVEHRDVGFYADACGLSPKYFAKQIFKVSGKHPLEWIKAHVILTAQAMLKSGDYSVAQICEALNFTSLSSFNRYFKSEAGMSPTDYQKQ